MGMNPAVTRGLMSVPAMCHRNPALEQQACDRVYRLGQTRDVTIHRFVCKDTIEEKILQLQKRKLQMADSVLTGSVVLFIGGESRFKGGLIDCWGFTSYI